MRIAIAHEAPIDILQDVANRTDYCYALVHLFEQNPRYYTHFKIMLTRYREVLLDNSIFELKKAFDAEKFAEAIDDLEPTMYIVPDVLEDESATVNNFYQWQNNYNHLPGLKIGAVQGKSYQELSDCYKFMVENADIVALSFDLSWYQQVGTLLNRSRVDTYKLQQQCTGRQHLITRLIDDGIWREDKPTHLLGASLAQEFAFYRQNHIKGIKSIDTSNPVMAGLQYKKYYNGIGLLDKPQGLLADNINCEVKQDQLEIIIDNIGIFDNIVNG